MIKKWLFLLPLMATAMLFAISPKIEASTINYYITFVPNEAISIWNGTNTITTNLTQWSRTDLVDLQGAEQITINGTVAALIFYNSNNINASNVVGIYSERVVGVSPRIGTLQANTNVINVPNGATHFLLTSLHENDNQWPITGNISYANFQTTTVTYENPIPYTIEQKNPYYDVEPIEFALAPTPFRTVFIQGQNYSDPPKQSYWNYGTFWWDDNGYNVGSTAGDNQGYADRVSYMNLVGELIYLNMPLPSNITEIGTYDLWFSLFDYNGDFKATYRPTSNNISVQTLRELGGYYFHLNYTENYAQLPDAYNFSIEMWRSETNSLLTFYDTDSTTLIQLSLGPTNEYQPGNNALWVDSNNGGYDIRDYLTANNISLPTKEGHTLIGFSYDYLADLGNRQAVSIYPEPSFVFGTGITNDLVFWPVFEQNLTYDVTFTDYDDSIIEVVTVEPGQTAIPTQTPTRNGYVFAYWEPPVTDIQGNLTTKAIYYVPITWRNSDFSTIRIDQVIEGQMPTQPTLEGYTRTWTPEIVNATEPTAYVMTSQTVNESSGVTPTTSGTTIFRTQLPDDYNGLTDLFGGVFGGIIGLVMTLGTIDLFGIELSAIIFLFVSASLGLTIFKMIRG